MAGLGKSVGRFFIIAKVQRLFGYITHMKNIPERKYKMPDYIYSFQFSILGTISNVFTAIGVISVILAIIRFVHNRRRKEWKSNVSIQDYPTDYDVEMECRNAIYSKIWTEETTVGLR